MTPQQHKHGKMLLKNYPIELNADDRLYAQFVKDAVIELNESYVLTLTETDEGNGHFKIEIHCPTTNFAMAYYMVGFKVADKILKYKNALL